MLEANKNTSLEVNIFSFIAYDDLSKRRRGIMMKLNFLLNNIKRDLNLIPTIDGDKVNIYDVATVIDRWAQALEDENTLKEYEQRFQELLVKESFMRDDYTEAIHLLMMIHRPLIDG